MSEHNGQQPELPPQNPSFKDVDMTGWLDDPAPNGPAAQPGIAPGRDFEYDPWSDDPHTATPPASADQYPPTYSYRPSVIDRLRGKAGRRIAVFTAAVALGGVATEVVAHEGPSHSSSTSASETPGTTEAPHSIKPIKEAVPAPIKRDIKKAIAVDTCKTKVTAAEVTATYQDLFMTHEAPNLTVDDLSKRTDEVTQKLSEDRIRGGYISLPKTFDKLTKDAEGDRHIPLSMYQGVAKEYFAQFGVQAIFEWPDADHILKTKPGSFEEQLIHFGTTPEHELEIGSNLVIRQRILSAMSDFTNLSPTLQRTKAVKAIAFGNMNDPKHGGFAPLDSKGLFFIDTHNGANMDDTALAGNKEYDHKTPMHESWHRLANGICGLLLARQFEDPAYTSFNDGFTYSQDHVKALSSGKLVGKHFATMDAARGKAVVTYGYGAGNVDEDKATNVGEYILYAPAIQEYLSADKKGSMSVIYEKAALEITRLSKTNPEEAAHIKHLFAAARVANEVGLASQVPAQKLGEYTESHFEERQNGTLETDPEYIRLQAAFDSYQQMLARLQVSISGMS